MSNVFARLEKHLQAKRNHEPSIITVQDVLGDVIEALLEIRKELNEVSSSDILFKDGDIVRNSPGNE